MLDLHPVSEERVESAGRVIGVIAEPEFITAYLPNAEERLAQAVRDGLYVLEAEEHFDFREHFDTTAELLEARRERLVEQAQMARRIAAAAPPLATIQRTVLRRFAVQHGEVLSPTAGTQWPPASARACGTGP